MDTIPNETKIIINVKIKEKTTINYRNFPIFFDIILNPPLQISEPEVLCKSNFCFPSLYNNKLLWNFNKKIQNFILFRRI